MSYYHNNHLQEQQTGYAGYAPQQHEFFDAQQYERQAIGSSFPKSPPQAPANSPYEPAYLHDGPQQQQSYVPPLGQSSFSAFNLPGEGGHVAAGLCYIGFWLTGLLFLLFEPKNRFVRFHAMQSLLFFGGVNLLYFVFINMIIEHIPFLFGFAIFAFVIMNIVAFVAWIVGMVGAFNGKYVKLPFVGDIAERYANRNGFPR